MAANGNSGGGSPPDAAPLAVTLTDVPPAPDAPPGAPPIEEATALRIDLSDPPPTPPSAPSTVQATSAGTKPPETSDEPEATGPRTKPSPSRVAAIWLFAGVGVLALAQVPIALSQRTKAHAAASATVASAAASSASAPSTSASASDVAPSPPPPDEPPPFRVAQLEQDPSLEITHARVGKHGCEGALLSLGLDKTEIARVARALAPVRKITACRPTDQLFVAATREGRKVRALEIELAPGDLVQVRERAMLPSPSPPTAPSASASASASAVAIADEALVAERVSLPVTHRRQAVGLIVQTDLAAAVVAAGLDASILEPLDDAIDARGDLGAVGRGAVFRVVADSTYVAGRFDRYDRLVAFEYRPSIDGKPVRVYNLPEPPHPSADPKPQPATYFDASGHSPVRSRWRMPLLVPRITSRFNPRRMHPILHTIMPHNGCDFGAPVGTPVYAIGPGVVIFRGNAGATGNFVSIQHDGGFESGYAHLSRFAPGIAPGVHVESRQLVGYVGSTGRSTGPHLHLSVKRNGQFIDPLTLKLDAKRVVPPKQRDAFAKQRADADAALDAIPLPKVDKADLPAPPASASASASASAAASGPASAELDDVDDDHPR